MKKNCFKELEHELIQNYDKYDKSVEHKVHSTIGTYKFFGDIIDLYIVKLIDTIVDLSGGKTYQKPDH